MSDLLPATVGVTPGGGWVAWAIRLITRGPVAHAFIATGDGDQIVEGAPHGARYNRASAYSTVYWLPELSAGLTGAQRATAVGWARGHVGTPYSFVDDAEIAFVDLFGWAPGWMRRRLRSDRTLMCSQLCCAALRAAGRVLFPGRPDGGVSPNDLWRLAKAAA